MDLYQQDDLCRLLSAHIGGNWFLREQCYVAPMLGTQACALLTALTDKEREWAEEVTLYAASVEIDNPDIVEADIITAKKLGKDAVVVTITRECVESALFRAYLISDLQTDIILEETALRRKLTAESRRVVAAEG